MSRGDIALLRRRGPRSPAPLRERGAEVLGGAESQCRPDRAQRALSTIAPGRSAGGLFVRSLLGDVRGDGGAGGQQPRRALACAARRRRAREGLVRADIVAIRVPVHGCRAPTATAGAMRALAARRPALVRVPPVSSHRLRLPARHRRRSRPARPDPFEAAVAGYERAFRALPRSVRHIVVIRDPPYIRYRTFSCIRRALADHRSPGPACALPRARVLKPDPAIKAVRRMRSPRMHGIDMTHFFCDETRCFPVIGGALVKKDKGHLTRVYATTTAPFLRRKINRLMRSW